MEKKLLLFTLLLGIFEIIQAQDFAPSVQAQGYLNGKNMMVDYCTGQFHYNIPLFELESGAFKLPISLNYSNFWSLQNGGVVTRVVRGGIPDEKNRGYDYIGSLELKDDLKSVNAHVRDGESDIFTVSFNGRSVHFIVKKWSPRVLVEPLERTNVKIEFLGLNSGWAVTDENGVEYIYEAPEWTIDVKRKAIVGTNNVKDEGYISSWYLTKIKIPGAGDIDYVYKMNNSEYLTDTLNTVTSRNVSYFYGRPMVEYPFDFKKYKYEYENEIALAEKALLSYNLLAKNYNCAQYNYEFEFIEVVFDSFHRQEYFFSMLGTLGEFSKIPLGTRGLIENLERLAYDLRGYPNVVSHLEAARNYVIFSLTDEKMIYTSEEKLTTNYQIVSPRLERIVTMDKEIQILQSGNKRMEINLLDYKKDLIRKVSLLHGGNLSYLERIVWSDCDLKETDFYDIDYGDYGTALLKCIKTNAGGRISLGYERNICSRDTLEGYRIKWIASESGDGKVDSIKYKYVNSGIPVYNSIEKWDTLHYSSFDDRIFSSDFFYKGNVYVSNGNNGVYYDYVEEYFVGKGSNNYLFSVPDPSIKNVGNTYPFWLCGLLLAKGTYDESGYLVACQRNTYITDLNVSNVDNYATYFENSPASLRYSKSIDQVRPVDYYVDNEALYKYYRSQPDILLYEEGIKYKVQKFFSPEAIYNSNFFPRKNFKAPNQYYQLIYGGKTLLKSQKEFLFTGKNVRGPSKSHLNLNTLPGGIVVSDIEFCYDHPEVHVQPTRIVRKLTNGDEEIILRRTPLDFQPGTATWVDEMLTLNIVSPVIKEQEFLKKKGTAGYKLLREEVTCYKKGVVGEDKKVFFPEKKYEYLGFESFPMPNMVTDNQLQTFPDGKYKETSLSYMLMNNEYLPVCLANSSGRDAMVYDQGRNNLIMEARNVARTNIDAVDYYRMFCLEKFLNEKLEVAGLYLSSFLEIQPTDGVKVFSVFLLIEPIKSTLDINYVIHHAQGSVHLSSGVKSVAPGKWQLVSFDIEISGYSSVTSVKLSLHSSGVVAMGVIAPLHTLFKATSSDSFGRVFCTFDQNGNLELNEYNSGGNLSRQYNKDGNLLKEYRYNRPKGNE